MTFPMSVRSVSIPLPPRYGDHVATGRRVGNDTSTTRSQLLDCAQELMIESGYAAVTYRKVAAKAGVTGGLVQYYFPTLDDLLIAGIERATKRNIARLQAAIDARPDATLDVIWEFTRDEAAAAVMLEYIALGNHRKSIQAAIAQATLSIRAVQMTALENHWLDRQPGDPSPEAMLFLMNGLSKMIQLEAGLGIEDGHAEVAQMMEQFIRSRATSPG
jgi:TetR/AcrR family transcriptional repressor of nem operon